MVNMSEKERAKIKLLLRGLENLLGLGGFIKEQIEEEIYELYPSIVISKTKKHCPLGPGFWNVADAVEIAERETIFYTEYVFDENGEPDEVPNSGFDEWLVDQVAKIEIEKYRNEKSSFWLDWEFTKETKMIMMRLNGLDERVLYLSSGVGNVKKLNALEIAELPEFSCSEKYISKVINAIEKQMNYCEWSNDEFNQVCNEHRSR